MASEGKRCCGADVCIINAEGYCWCGLKWDGEKMARPASANRDDHDDKKSADSELNAQRAD